MLAHNNYNFVWWEKHRYSALALICHAHLIMHMNARLFEGGSYFFKLTKSAATIRGVATIQVNTVYIPGVL